MRVRNDQRYKIRLTRPRNRYRPVMKQIQHMGLKWETEVNLVKIYNLFILTEGENDETSPYTVAGFVGIWVEIDWTWNLLKFYRARLTLSYTRVWSLYWPRIFIKSTEDVKPTKTKKLTEDVKPTKTSETEISLN